MEKKGKENAMRRVSFAAQNSERTYNKASRPSDAGLPQRKATSTPAAKRRRHSVGSVANLHKEESPTQTPLTNVTNVPTDDDLFQQFEQPAPTQSILKNPLQIRQENPKKRRRESLIFGPESPEKGEEEATCDYTGIFDQIMAENGHCQATDTQDYTQQLYMIQRQNGTQEDDTRAMDFTKPLPTNIIVTSTSPNTTQDLTMDFTTALPTNFVSFNSAPPLDSPAPLAETPKLRRMLSLSCVSEEEDVSAMESTMEFTKTFSSFPDTNPAVEFTETLPNTINFRRRSSLGRRQSFERVRTSFGGRVPTSPIDDATMDLTAALTSKIKLFSSSQKDPNESQEDMTMDMTGTLTSHIKTFSTPKKQLDEPMEGDENPELFETTADYTAALAGIFSTDQFQGEELHSYHDQLDLLKEMAPVHLGLDNLDERRFSVHSTPSKEDNSNPDEGTPLKLLTPLHTPIKTPKQNTKKVQMKEDTPPKYTFSFQVPAKTPTPPRKQPLRGPTPSKPQQPLASKSKTPQKAQEEAETNAKKATGSQLSRFDNPSFRQFLTSVDLLRAFQNLCKDSTGVIKKNQMQQRNKLGTPSQDDYFRTNYYFAGEVEALASTSQLLQQQIKELTKATDLQEQELNAHAPAIFKKAQTCSTSDLLVYQHRFKKLWDRCSREVKLETEKIRLEAEIQKSARLERSAKLIQKECAESSKLVQELEETQKTLVKDKEIFADRYLRPSQSPVTASATEIEHPEAPDTDVLYHLKNVTGWVPVDITPNSLVLAFHSDFVVHIGTNIEGEGIRISSMSCRLSQHQSKYSETLFSSVMSNNQLERHIGSTFTIPLITRVLSDLSIRFGRYKALLKELNLLDYMCKDVKLTNAAENLHLSIIISDLPKRRRYTVGLQVGGEYPLGRIRYESLVTTIGEIDEIMVKKVIVDGEKKEGLRLVSICSKLRAL